MMAVQPERNKKQRPALDQEALERLAVGYLGRFATTRAKLRSYLVRKLRERGWQGQGEPRVEAIVERFAELGYVDDRAFASSRAASLGRRGYGERRVAQALQAAGIEEADAAPAREEAQGSAWQAALRFAERRKIGPFSAKMAEPPERHKAFAAMVRAGHPLDLVKKLVAARPGEIPEGD